MNVVVYIIVEASLIIICSPLMLAAVSNAASKIGVSRKTLLICAQVPMLALSLVYFTAELVTYKPPTNGFFGGWRYAGNLGLGPGIAMFTLISSVLTTTVVFIIAVCAKKESEA